MSFVKILEHFLLNYENEDVYKLNINPVVNYL